MENYNDAELKKINELRLEARSCPESLSYPKFEEYGLCDWEKRKKDKNHFCYYCPKFDKLRD